MTAVAIRAALAALACGFVAASEASGEMPTLMAGTAVVDVSDRSQKILDPCHAKVLVLVRGNVRAALVTIDAVAIGGIGRIGDGFLPVVRRGIESCCGIPASGLIVNASHCHGIVREDVAEVVIDAVRRANASVVPVRAYVGSGREDRISENRRLRMKDGSEIDLRRAYSSPDNNAVAGIGAIDPTIGLMRLDRVTGGTLAVVYVFACHPIMNPPWKGSSADFPGVASSLIERTIGDGTTAFFVQGCGGDINPLGYKDLGPPDATPLGLRLGASVLRALDCLQESTDASLATHAERIDLPRADDHRERIEKLEAERRRLVDSLVATPINFREFLPLVVSQGAFPDAPSLHRHRVLHEESLGMSDIADHDASTRQAVADYRRNLDTMEAITRLNVNLALLERHREVVARAASDTLSVDVHGLRVGDFRLVTFPGELSAAIGMDIRESVGCATAFVAGYTNGYIHYAPTPAQRRNAGYAQEDCDSMVAAGWLERFEPRAVAILESLGE